MRACSTIMLWTFNDRAFVPHEIYRDDACRDTAAPVYLTADPNGGPGADLLINLSNRMPGQTRALRAHRRDHRR